jgi:hypothetical protein
MATQTARQRDAAPAPGHPLALALRRLRGFLEGKSARAGAEDDREAPLGLLARTFRLTPFERDIVALCAALEIDPHFADLCAQASGDPQQPWPTFSLALRTLPDAHWTATLPNGPLRYWRLIDVRPGDTLVTSRLRVDEPILHYLSGLHVTDERLQALLLNVEPSVDLPESQRAVAAQIVECWSGVERTAAVAVHLCGPTDAGPAQIAAAACAQLGLRLDVLRAESVPASASEREEWLRLWHRESALANAALLVDYGGADPATLAGAHQQFIDRLESLVLVAATEPMAGVHRSMVRLDCARPTSDEQQALWQATIGSSAPAVDAQIDRVVSHFRLGSRDIRAVGARVRDGAGTDAGPGLWEACRVQTRAHMHDLAQRVEGLVGWDDLVLPDAQMRLLREIAMNVRWRRQVYEQWGFARRSPRGLSISALFFGPSGTGKTMAAEVLARELELDLFRIDLSSVVSKYIGETEKNLRRVFDAAEAGGAVLLFDEADALFGHRSEVRDSHDRYANIEVSYLLQRMEAYRGLAILTSNMKQALDPAFLRRIRFFVQFPFPEEGQRAEIWRRVFPAHTPTEGLSIDTLARLSLAGGSIQNVALAAAFLAADEGVPVRMSHLLSAVRTECQKLERPLTDAEIGGWL